MIWKLPHREVLFPRRPLIMGIVNINDDSFSGDGTLDPQAAFERAKRQIEEGADVLDAGAESARTNREAISPAEEIRRFIAFLERWPELLKTARPAHAAQLWPPVLSANTWRPEVAEAVLPRGVELLNDMGGLPDAANARLCAASGASLLIMHSVGKPKEPHRQQQWPDIMGALRDFFAEKIALAESAGLPREAVILDPGLDFAKQLEDNLTILREFGELTSFGRPLLAPIGRKSLIGRALDIAEPAHRDAGTIACLNAAISRGASIVRVHDVRAARQAIDILHALDQPGSTVLETAV